MSESACGWSVIIPTHNEAQAIGRVLADLPSDLVTEVSVVDSDSTDGTPEAADVGNDLIQLARELRLAPAKAPRTAAWVGEWEQAVAHLRQGLGEL
jgi:hypothetical protein